METSIYNVTNENELNLSRPIQLLREGNAIIFPTETVYGLGADIYNDEAVHKIYEIKSRNYSNPLAAHIGKLDDIYSLTKFVPDELFILAEAFLPGPLSIILPKNENISNLVTANLKTIGIRFPDDKVALKLINDFGSPLAATSSNISGQKSPINGIEAYENLNKRVPFIIDNGTTKYQKESTIISLVENHPVILRVGVISKNNIEAVLKIQL